MLESSSVYLKAHEQYVSQEILAEYFSTTCEFEQDIFSTADSLSFEPLLLLYDRVVVPWTSRITAALHLTSSVLDAKDTDGRLAYLKFDDLSKFYARDDVCFKMLVDWRQRLEDCVSRQRFALAVFGKRVNPFGEDLTPIFDDYCLACESLHLALSTDLNAHEIQTLQGELQSVYASSGSRAVEERLSLELLRRCGSEVDDLRHYLLSTVTRCTEVHCEVLASDSLANVSRSKIGRLLISRSVVENLSGVTNVRVRLSRSSLASLERGPYGMLSMGVLSRVASYFDIVSIAKAQELNSVLPASGHDHTEGLANPTSFSVKRAKLQLSAWASTVHSAFLIGTPIWPSVDALLVILQDSENLKKRSRASELRDAVSLVIRQSKLLSGPVNTSSGGSGGLEAGKISIGAFLESLN